ncbi:MAG: permease [Bacteroidetes bacterium]|nr:permease [Bacteroidota bacterium]
MEFIKEYFVALFNLTADMAPYLLLGFLFAGLLKVFLPANLMSKYLGKSSFSSVLNATILGIPLPLCSCGVLPAGISLHKNGASKGASVSFLVSTPQTGVDSILVTWSMLGLPFAIIRPIAALFTGIAGGLLTNKIEKEKVKPVEPEPQFQAIKQNPSLKEIFRYAFVEMLNDIAKWLIIGLLIAAFIEVLIPDNFFSEFQISGILGMLIILIASIPLYVCATSSVPIAAVLLLKGISPGALLVFLMAGPATNAAAITVIGQNMGKKTVAIYLSVLIAGSLLFGLLIDYLLPGNWFMPLLETMNGHEHSLLPLWLNYLSVAFLTFMLVYNYYNRIKHNIMNKKAKSQISRDIPEMKISVEGMTCQHCKRKVEEGLLNIDGISGVTANPDTDTVEIYGQDLKLQSIRKIVEELGYDYKGEL